MKITVKDSIKNSVYATAAAYDLDVHSITPQEQSFPALEEYTINILIVNRANITVPDVRMRLTLDGNQIGHYSLCDMDSIDRHLELTLSNVPEGEHEFGVEVYSIWTGGHGY